MKDNRPKAEIKKKFTPTPTAPRGQDFDMPWIEGEEINESFIEKQRAIEEEFMRNQRRR